MNENQKTKEEIKAMADIFSEMPDDNQVEADFPTGGKFYDSNGPVLIRAMTFEDEKSLATIKDPDLALRTILSRCVSNLDIQDLITCDKDYLLMKIRSLTYGQIYKANVTCPKCESKSEVSIDIDNFVVNKLPKDFNDPRKVTLPVLKKEVEVRFLRERDLVSTNAKDLLDNLWRYVVSIAGYDNPKIINEALKKMKLVDIKVMMSAIKGTFEVDGEKVDPGIDQRFYFTCPSCKSKSLMEAPIGSDFFTPS